MHDHSEPHTNRRGFLTHAAAAGAAFSVSRTAISAQPSGDGKLGIALVGLGGFATRSIAPELAACKHVRLAGVVTGDPDGKGRDWAARYGFDESSIYTYDSMDQMRGDKSIDMVHIVTPNGLHAEHTIRAAEAGKHVMCEKPMAISAAECEAMIDACRRAGVRLGVSYRLHYEPHHVEMARMATEKQFGELKCITAGFSWNRRDNKPWLLDKSLAGGGAFFDTGVYTVQAGCYLTGETPDWVSAIGQSTRDVYPPGIEETMCATFKFPSGAVMQARASYTNGDHDLIATAERGTFSCSKPAGKFGSTFGQSVGGNPNGKVLNLPGGKTFKRPDTLQLAVLLDAFAESIKTGGEFLAPGEMGLRDLRIIEAVYRSAEANGAGAEIR